MAGKKKSYGAKLRNWPVAHLRLALCSLGTLYTRHSHSPAGTLHIMHRPATLYMGCSQDVPLALCTCVIVLALFMQAFCARTQCSPHTFCAGYSFDFVHTLCSPDSICTVAFKIYLEHNNDDNLNFVGMALDACLSGSKELHAANKIGLIVASMFCVCLLLKWLLRKDTENQAESYENDNYGDHDDMMMMTWWWRWRWWWR